MRKYIILILCLVLILSGCAETSSVPEPFKLAMEEIQNEDFDLALKYLDMAIEEYADNEEYVYNAHFYKSLILWSKLESKEYCIQKVTDSMLNIGNYGYSKEELEELNKYCEQMMRSIEEDCNSFNKSMTYIYSNKKEKIYLVDYKLQTELNSNAELFVNTDGFTGITKEELFSLEKYAELYKVQCLCNDLIDENGNINFSQYYLLAFKWTNNNEFGQRLLEKVIKLTENDKYDKSRIQAQELLTQMNS